MRELRADGLVSLQESKDKNLLAKIECSSEKNRNIYTVESHLSVLHLIYVLPNEL